MLTSVRHPVSRLYPPPPRHPTTGHRLVACRVPICFASQGGFRPKNPDLVPLTSSIPPETRFRGWLETLALAGWTAALLPLSGRRHPPLSPNLPLPLFFIPTARASAHRGWSRIRTLATRYPPLAVISPIAPSHRMDQRIPCWRLREVLPSTYAPDPVVLTTPDPRALTDPRLMAWWIATPLSPQDPMTPRWRDVLAARPEVPVLIDISMRDWDQARMTREAVCVDPVVGVPMLTSHPVSTPDRVDGADGI